MDLPQKISRARLKSIYKLQLFEKLLFINSLLHISQVAPRKVCARVCNASATSFPAQHAKQLK
jgi:hypothetical protein